jgi:50S ribosomal protein L16 3-hydroxylase
MSPPPPLGTLSPTRFMRESWHREARLIRQAIPDFTGLLDRDGILELACDPDVESRLVVREGRRWHLEHGPFSMKDFIRLPGRNWTVLVQGVNLHLDAADRLLHRFDFVPAARLDDLMVSYAVPGGGVGPHFDSYDVFLLQGPGRRRWRAGRQSSHELRPGMPLKILKHFAHEHEWVLDLGDMLYLPPDYAHDGVAVDECFTYSIGFRAPTRTELAGEFFSDLSTRLDLPGRYADPGQPATRAAGRVPAAMIDATVEAISAVRWNRSDVADFLGVYLSEPKAHVFFEPPEKVPAPAAFAKLVAKRGVSLDRRTILLYGPKAVYLNGECIRFPRGVPEALVQLADRRMLTADALPGAMVRLLHSWFADGFLTLSSAAGEDDHA